MLWLLPAAGVDVLKPYQVQRLTGFLHPDSDPRGATYNITQSNTAVGAGGVDGRGVRGATQTSLNYLPEHATDFVFASLAEQRGFVGAVDPAPALPARRLARPADRHRRRATCSRAIVAGGIVFAFLFQIFVNVGMTMGIAPITGIPLPFVSVGGSSMIANLTAMGVLLVDPRPRHALPAPLVALPIKPGAVFGVVRELGKSEDRRPLRRRRARRASSRASSRPAATPSAVRVGGPPDDRVARCSS